MYSSGPTHRYNLFFIILLGLFLSQIDAYSVNNSRERVIIDQRIPVEKQFSKTNTEYVVDEEIEIGWIDEGILKCGNKCKVVRKRVSIDLQQNTSVNGITYYCNSTPIKVYWNEFISIPKDCIILSSDKKEVLSKEGDYCPGGSGKDVYVASKNYKTVACEIGKILYIHGQSLTLNRKEGISIPANCVLLSDDKHNILTYTNVYCTEERTQCYIASLIPEDVEYKIGDVLTIPEGSSLRFHCNGKLRNGIINCQNTSIDAPNIMIFKNIVLVGSIANNYVSVEWFGCNTKQSGDTNQEIYERYILPTVLGIKTNVFHSKKGVYSFSNGYPLRNHFWGYDHEHIMDCKSIEVFGRGKKTVIQGLPRDGSNPADVFSFVDMKNFSIHDLTVRAIQGAGHLTYGTNAFSLIHNLENISIHHCYVYNLPYVEKDAYPDGGKAYTIQVGTGTSQRNITIAYNYARNVAYGLDYTKVKRDGKDILEGVVFHNNRIENAIVGCVIHQWDSPEGERVSSIEVSKNDFINCQVGVNCQTCKGVVIKDNTISNTTTIKRTKYYDGVYGVYLVGAYNVDISGNTISLNNCDSFVKATVYSYIPKYNGRVSNINIKNNLMRGKNSGFVVDIGSSATRSSEEQMYKDIEIDNNKIKTKGGKSFSSLGESFLK